MKFFSVCYVLFSIVYSQNEDEIFSGCIDGIEEFIFIPNIVNSTEANEICEKLGIDAVGVSISDRITSERVFDFISIIFSVDIILA